MTGASDDRTFVVSTMQVAVIGDKPSRPVTWYLLRIEPGGTPGYRLTRLAIPDMRSWGVQAIALSGSGRELAMTLFPATGKARWVVRIYSVATGKLLRTWSSASGQTSLGLSVTVPGLQGQQLSWADGDRAVVFPTFGIQQGAAASTTRESLRLLDVTAGSGNLLGDSRVIWSTPTTSGANAPPGCLADSPRLTADGTTVVCVTGPVNGKQGDPHVTLAWLAYSTSSARVPRVLYKVTVDAPSSDASLPSVLWSDASGSTLIAEWSVARSITASAVRFGVVSQGRFRPLPPVPTSLGGLPVIAW